MNISFSLTTPQFKARTKDVTRRLGWKNLKPGQVLQACEKCQGLKKGQHPVKLGPIEVVSVRRERLDRLDTEPLYGFCEVVHEGFPKLNPQQFIDMFCRHNRCKPETIITRLEFKYL